MFSTIKSIIKTLSVFSLFATLVVAGLSNVNASAITCFDGTRNVEVNAATCPRAAGSGNSDLTPNNLCGTNCPLLGPSATSGKLVNRAGVSDFILNIARFLIYIASAISVLFIVWGGYQYISDGGDAKRAETGKKILINALIGLAICILAVTIVTFIGSTLEGNLVGSIVG
jgi:Type IV secretion system pilin